MWYDQQSLRFAESHVRTVVSTTERAPDDRPQPTVALSSNAWSGLSGLTVNSQISIASRRHRSVAAQVKVPEQSEERVYTLYHVVGDVLSTGANVHVFVFAGVGSSVAGGNAGMTLTRHWPIVGRPHGKGVSVDQVVAFPPQEDDVVMVFGVAFFNATGGPVTVYVTGQMSVDRLVGRQPLIIDQRIS